MLPWLLGCCSYQLRKSCAGANMVYSREKRVFILEYYFSSKSFAAVCEALDDACRKNKVHNTPAGHQSLQLLLSLMVHFKWNSL
jgi:hypothetical protein